MFTYFPKLSRSDANPSSDQSHSATIGVSDHTDTPQKLDQPPEKNKEELTKSSTDENRHFQVDFIELRFNYLSQHYCLVTVI